jgi:hypothetical protein
MSGDHNMYASGSGDGQRSGWRKRQVLDMAREAGFVTLSINEDKWGPYLEHFAELVRTDEREACAKVCDEYDVAEDVNSCDTAEGIALAIRARGEQA